MAVAGVAPCQCFSPGANRIDIVAAGFGFFLYYPSRRQQPAALSALINTLRL